MESCFLALGIHKQGLLLCNLAQRLASWVFCCALVTPEDEKAGLQMAPTAPLFQEESTT